MWKARILPLTLVATFVWIAHEMNVDIVWNILNSTVQWIAKFVINFVSTNTAAAKNIIFVFKDILVLEARMEITKIY